MDIFKKKSQLCKQDKSLFIFKRKSKVVSKIKVYYYIKVQRNTIIIL